jgi:hypothetical protein
MPQSNFEDYVAETDLPRIAVNMQVVLNAYSQYSILEMQILLNGR